MSATVGPLWWSRYPPDFLIPDKGDFRYRLQVDGSVEVVCSDHPYISTDSRKASTADELYDRYGPGELKGRWAVRAVIDTGLLPSFVLAASC